MRDIGIKLIIVIIGFIFILSGCIQEETNIAKDIIFKIISDMNTFKITSTGTFALR